MAKLEHYFTQFEEGGLYHIYNRSVDGQPLFRSDRNYVFFLEKLKMYLKPVADIYAWCLLGNHFHLMVRIKTRAEMAETVATLSRAQARDLTTFTKLSNLRAQAHTYARKPRAILPDLSPEKSVHTIVSHQLQKCFQSYAMAYNKAYNRTGTLFQTPFKRSFIHSHAYAIRLLIYIHQNPEKHGIIQDYRDWKWNSYHELIHKTPILIDSRDIFQLTGGRNAFLTLHQLSAEADYSFEWAAI